MSLVFTYKEIVMTTVQVCNLRFLWLDKRLTKEKKIFAWFIAHVVKINKQNRHDRTFFWYKNI